MIVSRIANRCPAAGWPKRKRRLANQTKKGSSNHENARPVSLRLGAVRRRLFLGMLPEESGFLPHGPTVLLRNQNVLHALLRGSQDRLRPLPQVQREEVSG